MELNYAEHYGIDLKKLREESFDHMSHVRMLKKHYRRVRKWERLMENWHDEQKSLLLRHTENNVSASTESGTITTTEKNGN